MWSRLELEGEIMAFAVSVSAIGIGIGIRRGWSFLFCHCHRSRKRVNPPNTPSFGIRILENPILRFSTATTRTRTRSCVVRARAPDEIENSNKEDLTYVGKLVAGSLVGAGAIKYGSALFPEITRPNIVQALFIILTPLLLALLLLIKQSRLDTRER